LEAKSREVPIGVANGKYFALTFVIGLTQAVSDNVSDQLKKKLGQLAYVLELFRQSAKHEPFKYEVTSPSLRKPLKGISHQILVYNSDLNQQVKLVPDHELKKPTLKVVISRCGHSKMKLWGGFIAHIVSFGKWRPYMRVFEAKELEIATKPKLPADYDGEIHGQCPFQITMCKRKIRIIC
jgi:diacylglycerol kinase family enzyme